jgi:hypothetical protein
MNRTTWPFATLRDVGTALYDSTDRDDWPNGLVVGTLLTLTAGHLLPGLALVGYAVRVLRSGLAGTPRLPGIDDWTGLCREAVPATGLLLAYQALPLAAAALLAGAAPLAGGLGGLAGTPWGSPVGVTPGAGVASGLASVPVDHSVGQTFAALATVLGLLAAGAVVLVLEAVASYLSLLALTNYVRTGAVRAGFDVRALGRAATRPRNVALWLVCAGSSAVVAGLAGVLAVVPVVGRLLGAAVAFVGVVATVSLWGRGVEFPAGGGVRHPAGGGEETAAADGRAGDGSVPGPRPRRSANVD